MTASLKQAGTFFLMAQESRKELSEYDGANTFHVQFPRRRTQAFAGGAVWKGTKALQEVPTDDERPRAVEQGYPMRGEFTPQYGLDLSGLG
ncbi:MAG: hypothetical protein IMW86_07925 [Hydrogenibacillus sp.]|nr:hypothetical protein [Hydrogenibacillus sp.]